MSPVRRGSHGARAVDASMSLLNEVLYRPVDAGYAEAAARPHAERTPRQRSARRAVNLTVAAALGLTTAMAIAELRAPQADALESRTVLAERIAARTADADALAASNDALNAEISQLQSDALADANPGLFAELEELELLSGSLPVTGPGLVIELDDAEVPDQELADPESRVQDIDLQVVTNGLWAAGAEAIAINGQRLTALSAVRGAGQAILVDLVPLIAPYRVEAIGDVRAMQTEFARSRAAGHLALLTGTYGIAVETSASDDLTLPGAPTTTLRYAAQADGDVASSSRPDQEGSP